MPIYMKLDGIAGLARAGPYGEWHKIESFSWSMQNTTSQGSGFQSRGRINVSEIALSKISDKSSALFIQNCTLGKHIPKAEINFTAGTQQDMKYATIKLEDVLISSYQVGCSAEDFPVESFSVSFAKYDLEFSKLDVKTGKVDAGAKFAYNILDSKA